MTIDTGTEHGQPSDARAKAEIAEDSNEMKQREWIWSVMTAGHHHPSRIDT
jgi:hypothetical protein